MSPRLRGEGGAAGTKGGSAEMACSIYVSSLPVTTPSTTIVVPLPLQAGIGQFKVHSGSPPPAGRGRQVQRIAGRRLPFPFEPSAPSAPSEPSRPKGVFKKAPTFIYHLPFNIYHFFHLSSTSQDSTESSKKRSPLSRASFLFMKPDSIFFSEIRICSSGKRSKHRPDLHPCQRQLRMHIQHGAERSSGGLR